MSSHRANQKRMDALSEVSAGVKRQNTPQPLVFTMNNPFSQTFHGPSFWVLLLLSLKHPMLIKNRFKNFNTCLEKTPKVLREKKNEERIIKDAMKELQISYGSLQHNRPHISLPYSSATSDSLVFPLGSKSLRSIVVILEDFYCSLTRHTCSTGHLSK